MDIPLGPADLHILLALSRRPMHGLGIAEDVAMVTDQAVVLGPATLYRSLKEMSDAGLITRVPPTPNATDARRKVYALTPRGIEQLREGLAVVQRVAEHGRRRLRRLDAQRFAPS